MARQRLLLGAALAAGLLAAVVDARPNFDDTGMLVGGLLLASGLLGLFSRRAPWLLALAAGIWIPLHDVILLGNYGSLLALAVVFGGAYAGWGGRILFNKAWA